MSNQTKLLLTGATGLVGSHTLLKLIENGIYVRAFVRPNSDYRKRIEEVFSLFNQPASLLDQYVSFFEGDLLNIGDLEDALEGIESVIHTAAIVREGFETSNRLMKVNVEGTTNLVNLCLDFKISWFLFLSSVATLGPNPEGMVDEDFFFKSSPNITNYALSKYLAEQEVWRASEEGLPVVILNPSIILGASRSKQSSSAIFHAAKNNIPFYTNGLHGYVDVVDVSIIIHNLYTTQFTGKRFIVSSENIENYDFLKAVSESMKSATPRIRFQQWMIFPAIIAGAIGKIFNKKTPLVNRKLIRSAQNRNAYDNARIIEKTGIQFKKVQLSIIETALRMQKIMEKE
jgi:nucleoside-diphosphate-sugar epimerase